MEIFIFTLLDNDRWTVETSLSHPDSFYYKTFFGKKFKSQTADNEHFVHLVLFGKHLFL